MNKQVSGLDFADVLIESIAPDMEGVLQSIL